LPQGTEDLGALRRPAGRGRKRYRSREALARVVAERGAQAGLTGVGQPAGAEEPLPEATTRWIVVAVWGNLAAWQALVERLGWQVYVTNTTKGQ
jgi:hypothetical protein